MSVFDFRIMQNKIFVRLLPREWNEDDVRQTFGVYGNITSVILKR